MTREELARLVIESLDARHRYFNQPSRSEAQFEVWVALEKRLRDEAQSIIDGPESGREVHRDE